MPIRIPQLGLAFGVLLAPAAEGAAASEPVRVVALGTSLTEGIDWAQRLGQGLAACWGRPVAVERVAASGRTSSWGRDQVRRVAALRPSIVLVEFAMNDANWRRFVSLARSRENTLAIARGIRASVPDARVVLMTTNTVHGLRGMMRPRVGAYYAAYRELAAAEGLGLVDLAPLWGALSPERLRRAVPDGVHPTLDAFEEGALPEIVSVLTEGSCRG